MRGVLSSGVEYTHIGARPLVRVYSPAQTRQLMLQAHFRDVRVRVYHFTYRDTPLTAILGRFVGALRNPRFLDRVGRVGGWYVVARGLA
jgi:hypothetical protein